MEKRRPTAPNAASSGVKSEAEDKIPGGAWWRTMFGPAGYAEKHPPFPRVVSLVAVILFRTFPKRGRFELALRPLHVLTISNRTWC
jgi:hypothetical protein